MLPYLEIHLPRLSDKSFLEESIKFPMTKSEEALQPYLVVPVKIWIFGKCTSPDVVRSVIWIDLRSGRMSYKVKQPSVVVFVFIPSAPVMELANVRDSPVFYSFPEDNWQG